MAYALQQSEYSRVTTDRQMGVDTPTAQGCTHRDHRAEPPARVLDWIDSQANVTKLWLDQLIAEGDPNDLISLIHRQAAWLDLMRSRLSDTGD
ncbi:hypothetical protein [Henriciella litoralis]|uniref:hypothetical protein n=1 Tax=Henriciella litoralis TaxID=568102 RepID=UPI00111BF73C|nr:hypothetical protein [Henriciella litoralis]